MWGSNMSANVALKLLTASAVWLGLATACAQPADQGAGGTLEQIRVHGVSLEGNLEGDDPERDVFVYLPPSYASQPNRRYPVIYFLHGYTATAQAYVDYLNIPDAADAAIAAGVGEAIIVLPDAYTLFSGSMYANSPTIGDWESFIADDLVGYVDARYRTLPDRLSRGLSGHSMGGYGTLRIGMKRPDVFGALYAMSSCCLLNEAPSPEAVEAQIAERGDAPAPNGGFANALSAQAAAFAPNPDRPPRYYDWPTDAGVEQRLIEAKYLANSPLVMVDQYVPSLLRYQAIALDIGDADPLLDNNVRLDEALDRLGIPHVFEIYAGDHGNRVRARFADELLPFFSVNLTVE
jgi:S-formylglutathione hydrolase FrmB